MKSGKEKSKAEMKGTEILDWVSREGFPEQRSFGNNVLRVSRNSEVVVTEAE